MNYTNIIDKEAVKRISYEYLLFKLVQWKCENNKYQTVNDFNSKNDFTLTHLIVSPFFTCTANGSFDFLFDLFGEFYAFSDGHNSQVAQELLLIGKSKLVNFELDSTTNYRLHIKNIADVNFLNVIEQKILDQKVEGEVEFKNIFFVNLSNTKEKKIFEAIDNSIKALKKHTEEVDNLTGTTKSVFIDYTVEDITTISMQHRSWVVMQDDNVNDTEKTTLSKELVKKDIFVYAPIDELA
jgi:hypothetical protein